MSWSKNLFMNYTSLAKHFALKLQHKTVKGQRSYSHLVNLGKASEDNNTCSLLSYCKLKIRLIGCIITVANSNSNQLDFAKWWELRITVVSTFESPL